MASEIIKVILADDLLLDASEKEVADIIINIQTFIESGIMLLGSNEILITRAVLKELVASTYRIVDMREQVGMDADGFVIYQFNEGTA
jgi:hypothetical protein